MDIIATKHFTPVIDGSSCSMHPMSNMEFLLNRQNSPIETCNKTDIRKARYWFANEIMKMANEQNKNTDIRLMEG